MREDLPSGELQDLCPAKGDGQVPLGWARAIDQACTAWLLKRGLYGSPSLHGFFLSPAARQQSEAGEADNTSAPGAGIEGGNQAVRVSGEEASR